MSITITSIWIDCLVNLLNLNAVNRRLNANARVAKSRSMEKQYGD
jgi:hypothetical protein